MTRVPGVLFIGAVFFLALFLRSAPPVFSFGGREKAAASPDQSGPEGGSSRPSSAEIPAALSVPGPDGPVRNGDRVELAGRIRLLGSAPFPSMVLTGEDGVDWYLEDPPRALRSYEQRIVRLRGRVELREMILANGRSLGVRRFLLDAAIAETRDPPD